MGEYKVDFQMVGKIKIICQIRQTHIRFWNVTDYEHYVNSIDEGYGVEEAVFNGSIYKIITPQINSVTRSKYGIGCDLKDRTIEYYGKNCYIPSNGSCFIKCINFYMGEDYKQQYLSFIGKE